MLKSITVRNFKGIKSTSLDNLRRINILIGKNNSGKSTILDSLCFARAPLAPFDELDRSVLRNLLDRRVHRIQPAIEELFFRYNPSNEIAIELKFDLDRTIELRATYLQNRVQYKFLIPDRSMDLRPRASFVVDLSQNVSLNVDDVGNVTIQNPLDWIFSVVDSRVEQMKAQKPPKDFEEYPPFVYFSRLRGELSFLSKVTLIDAEFVRNIEDVERAFWADILKDRTDKKLTSILNKTYDMNIENFTFAPYRKEPGVRTREAQPAKLFTALPEISLHIDDQGDGFRYAFSILTVASHLRDTALLIEEPEVHQDPMSLGQIFHHLLPLLDQNNLQLFVTTHSLETLRVLTKIGESSGTRVFHLSRDSEGNFAVRGIEAHDAGLLTEFGVDLRAVDKTVSFLVVEGKQDEVFLRTVAKRLGKEICSDLLWAPQGQQQIVIESLVSMGKPIKVMSDYDAATEIKDVVARFSNSLKNKHKIEVQQQSIAIKDVGCEVQVFAAGLPGDSDLNSIGINHYSMDDYLLKLFSLDESVKTVFKTDLEDLKKRIGSLRDVTSTSKSKPFISLVGTINGGLSKEAVIQKIIETADPEKIKAVLGSLLDIFA